MSIEKNIEDFEDCLRIVKNYLDRHGFDGLSNGAECGCDIPDLVPCGSDFSGCTPGYKLIPSEGTDCLIALLY